MLVLCSILVVIGTARADTSHQVFFEGSDSQLDVYIIKGENSGPTLLLMGGIQGDEPGGYLAADLYADVSLKQGNMIVVPRANFPSIIKHSRGVSGDMNRKFALKENPSDHDTEVVGIIKQLMKKSDHFLNLHDGSGYYSPVWETPRRNPMRFGQSIISDAAEHTTADGKTISMEPVVERVLAKVNSQISIPEHRFRFNNHMTLAANTKHKEQRLSATFHALTRVGIPAFGIETSKDIGDFSLRVRYQALVINAFLDEFGIVLDNPKICLEAPYLKFLIVSVNGQTPIVVNSSDIIKVRQGDRLRIVHIEANYARGLSARIKGGPVRLNDLNHDVKIEKDTVVEVRKDRFLMAGIPVEVVEARGQGTARTAFHPRVRYFCVKVNDRSFVVEPGEKLTVMRGDTLTIIDPRTNLDPEDERAMKIDLRGFQATSSSDPRDDRGHCIDTAADLQHKYGKLIGDVRVFPLQAKLRTKVFGESFVAVAEPKLEYVVLRRSQGPPFVAYAGDKVELPGNDIVRIMDVKTNAPGAAPLFITMAGRTLRWGKGGSAGIDPSKLGATEMPLDVTRNGCSIGRIWLKQGVEFRLTAAGSSGQPQLLKVRY